MIRWWYEFFRVTAHLCHLHTILKCYMEAPPLTFGECNEICNSLMKKGQPADAGDTNWRHIVEENLGACVIERPSSHDAKASAGLKGVHITFTRYLGEGKRCPINKRKL